MIVNLTILTTPTGSIYLPTQQKEMATNVCVCVCVLYRLLPLSKTLVSSDSTAFRGGAGASITGDGGVAAGAGGGAVR